MNIEANVFFLIVIISEQMTDSQPVLGTRRINGDRKFSEIKIQNSASSNARKRLKFGKLPRKASCVQK